MADDGGKGLALLSGGGGKAGKDFPSAGAAGGFITAGYLSGNDGRP